MRDRSREIVRYPTLMERWGIDYSFEHTCRLGDAGKFPKRIKLSHRSVGWLADEIDEWVNARADARV